MKVLFPIFNNKDLVYLDSASTSQKPHKVINAITDFYSNYNSNVHRSVYSIAEKAELHYNETRNYIKEYFNLDSEKGVIFTKNATEGFNLLASSLSELYPIVQLTNIEHHSNYVSWKLKNIICIDNEIIDKDLNINLDSIKESIKNNPSGILSITHTNNSIGIKVPVKELFTYAKLYNYITILDGCQTVQHEKIDIKDLNCDFYVFSVHKMYGPMGVGVIITNNLDLLNKMTPYQGGGSMISSVSINKISYNDLPMKFEAGTPNVADIIATKYAFEFLNENFYTINKIEKETSIYLYEKLRELNFIKLITPYPSTVVSFTTDFHPHDIAHFCSEENVCIRSGFHCTEPLMNFLNLNGTCRVSLAAYNDKEDIDKLIIALKHAYNILS